jgi:hypothetical protein
MAFIAFGFAPVVRDVWVELIPGRSSVSAQVASRAWVVENDEKHFAPEMLV